MKQKLRLEQMPMTWVSAFMLKKIRWKGVVISKLSKNGRIGCLSFTLTVEIKYNFIDVSS